MDDLTLDDLEDLTDTTCPYCARPGNGEPCAPYCGVSDEATVACIDRAVLALGEG